MCRRTRSTEDCLVGSRYLADNAVIHFWNALIERSRIRPDADSYLYRQFWVLCQFRVQACAPTTHSWRKRIRQVIIVGCIDIPSANRPLRQRLGATRNIEPP